MRRVHVKDIERVMGPNTIVKYKYRTLSRNEVITVGNI